MLGDNPPPKVRDELAVVLGTSSVSLELHSEWKKLDLRELHTFII